MPNQSLGKQRSGLAGWLVAFLLAIQGIHWAKQYFSTTSSGPAHRSEPALPREYLQARTYKNRQKLARQYIYVKRPTSYAKRAHTECMNPTQMPYISRKIRAKIYRTTSIIAQISSADKVSKSGNKLRKAAISLSNAKELITPGKESASNPAKVSSSDYNKMPRSLASESTKLHETNGDFLIKTSADGINLKEKQPTSKNTTDVEEVVDWKEAAAQPYPRGSAAQMEDVNPNDAHATHDNNNINQTINGATCDLQQDCGENSESVLPPQESRSHHSGTARTPQQNGRGTDTAQRDKREVNAGSGKISRDGEKEKTLKGEDKERRQYIRSKSACGNGGERSPLGGGRKYSPNPHKTPKERGDKNKEDPHVFGNVGGTQPSPQSSPDVYSQLVDTIDQTMMREDEEAMYRVRKLAAEVTWPRTRGLHVRKAALYMSTWAKASKQIRNNPEAERRATEAILAGVQPRELREEVYLKRDAIWPEGGSASAPTHDQSIEAVGMLIVEAAKGLDQEEAYQLKQEKREKLLRLRNTIRQHTAQRKRTTAHKPEATRMPVLKTPIKKEEVKHTPKEQPKRTRSQMATPNVASGFMPDQDQSTLSEDDLEGMVSDTSEPDTLSPIIMANLVSKMTTHKREETLEMLHDMVDQNTGKPKANKVLAIIKYISPRKGRHFPTGESYKQRKARKAADELVQKEVLRKLRKWDRACRKSRMLEDDDGSDSEQIATPVQSSTNKESTPKQKSSKKESKPKTGSDKHPPETADDSDIDYYDMTPLERQEMRETKAAGGIKRRRQPLSMGMYPPPTSASEKPKMQKKLDSSGSVMLADWICNQLEPFDRRVRQFRLANPWYVPTLSEWVTPKTWKRISEDMLDEKDRTDGGPPNDIGVEAFLRGEGRYEGRREHGGKIIQGNVKGKLEALVWETKDTHMQAYEKYMDKWTKVTGQLRECEKPSARLAAKVMLKAIQPKALRERIIAKTYDGLGPEILSDEAEKWRMKVKDNTKYLRRLIRENADHWDRMG